MYIGNQRVWFRRKSGARFNRLVVLIQPAVPQAGECEYRIIGHPNAVRVLFLRSKALPLVESLRGNQAAAPSKCDDRVCS